MFMRGKRLLALVLALVMVCGLVPAGSVQAAQNEAGRELSQEDYAAADLVFDRIEAMESAPAKKNATQDEKTQAAMEIVLTSDSYEEGSLDVNGASFTWSTDSGIRCVYSPRMQKIRKDLTPEKSEDAIVNEPKALKGGSPSGNQVYLIGPYYGQDPDFTDQYKNEARRVAEAMGDTDGYTLYSGRSATVDKVAEAMSNGAVVFFDSHGMTDYENPWDEYDCVTGATNSYLCLTSTTGLTDDDYDDGALYDSEGIWINGATIANHMTKNSPGGILWMAICLGMATDTICKPMREKGVEVVYGYSESVTFHGDYLYEETFWDEMVLGKTVAQSAATMKETWGDWDWSETIAEYYGYDDGYATIGEARYDFIAFPIVVSDEDTYPGQRKGSSYGADIVQNVKSTYTLYTQYDITARSNNAAWGGVDANGNIITATPAEGYFAQSATVLSGSATVSQNGNTFFVSAESDCTVQINFAKKTVVSVNFSGANVTGQTGYAGDVMALPAAQAPEDYQFLGWMDAPLSSDTTEKPEFYTDSFTPTGDTTLYALYSYVDETSGSGTGDYVKVTESRDDWSGEYLIVYEVGSRVFDGSRSSLEATGNYQNVTIRDNTISAQEADAYRFVIAQYNNGYSIQSAGGKYISGTSGANKLNEGYEPAVNTIAIDAAGNADIVSNTSHLRYNATSGQDRFRYYKSTTYSSQKNIALYIKDGSAGTTYYTTSLCDHPTTQNTAAVAPTCKQEGYTAGVQCTVCHNYVSGHEVVAALGHNWGDWKIDIKPTCTEAGQKYHVCTVCGAIEIAAVYATGHTMGDGAVTTPATCTTDGLRIYTCSACGEKEKEIIPATGHNYVTNGLTTTCTVCGDSYTAATLHYVFDDYAPGVQYATAEEHQLDDVLTLTVNGGHLNSQLRLYSGSNAVISTDKNIDSIVVKAGYKNASLRVHSSTDGMYFYYVDQKDVTSSYANYSFELPEGTKYVMLEAVDAQVRIPEMTVVVSEIFSSVEPAAGDITGDGEVNNDDVVMLLWNTLFPEEYPLSVSADINKDGETNNDDVVLLLWHTLFPEEYPL